MSQSKKGHTRLNEERVRLQKKVVEEIFDQEDLEALARTGLPISVRHIPKEVLNIAGRVSYGTENVPLHDEDQYPIYNSKIEY